MKRTVLGFVGLSVWLLAGNASAADACDRNCLTATVDQYLDAVLKHDPSKAPLAANYRATENAVAVKAGEGTWKSVTALGAVQRRYVDPTSSQAAYFGLIDESGAPAIVSLRLKVVDRKVAEAEWVIGRKGMALYNIEGFTANPPPEGKVSATNRSSRDALIAAADSYFSGIQEGNGKIVLAHPGCYRVENGTWMLGKLRDVPATPAAPPPPKKADGSPGDPPRGNGVTTPRTPDAECITGFERMGGRGGAVINRRYLADEEAGVALGTVIFSSADGAVGPDGKPTKWLYLTEVFKVEQGKIRGIYAAMDYLPPEIRTSGW